MIEIRNVQTIDGRRVTHRIESQENRIIEADSLLMLPALIDPHVHFRVPGAEHKETWETAARAAIAGGVTTVFDMPNNKPACKTASALALKKRLIAEQLQKADIPLRHHLYLGADRRHLGEMAALKDQIIGLKIYMGSSTGDLLMEDGAALEEAFEMAAKNDILVAVHAEDEEMMKQCKALYTDRTDYAVHSLIRNPAVAAKAVGQAIALAEKTGARLYIAHVSSKVELDLIRAAKKKKLPVYAEATPHHLFLDDGAYGALGAKALVNPPLRSREDVKALWDAVQDGTIDTIGTDHAPHTVEEKQKPYGSAPSGLPGIEIYLALLLNAQLSVERIVSLTRTRIEEIFRLPPNPDVVLVDLSMKKQVDAKTIWTKVGWSPYAGRTLQGWPRYTICNGRVFDVEVDLRSGKKLGRELGARAVLPG